jgi:hypothetical protein
MLARQRAFRAALLFAVLVAPAHSGRNPNADLILKNISGTSWFVTKT